MLRRSDFHSNKTNQLGVSRKRHNYNSRSGKMADVSLIEFITGNKKIEASALHDDKFLENSYLNKFNASDELLLLA